MGAEQARRIFFRADGGSRRGLGHVVRSIALLYMLRDKFECSFLIREPSESSIRQIKEAGGRPIALPPTDDHLQEAVTISQSYFRPGDIVVVDGYHFDEHYQKVIKDCGCKLVAIDDMHRNYFLADVVINHGGGLRDEIYNCSSDTKLCLGPKFALLRPEFLRNRKDGRAIGKREVAFVCLGGADPLNLSAHVTEKLLTLDHVRSVNLVVGSANVFFPMLEELAARDPRVRLWRDVNAGVVVNLLKMSDFAVVPASSVSYEVASLGVPMFVGHYVDNQIDLYNFLVGKGLAWGLGDFHDDILWQRTSEFSGVADMVESQRKVFDGDSDYRLLKLFCELADLAEHPEVRWVTSRVYR